MKRRPSQDPWESFEGITNAAERFVNHTPRLKRLEPERQALLDAIRRAQLLLSVKHMTDTDPGRHVPSPSQVRHQSESGRPSRRR
jgi:hypothetical protein